MKKLLIATTNPGKLGEIKRFLKDLPIELLSLQDVDVKGQPEETGMTFEENAILKAKYYLAHTGIPTLADDGGFEIDALGGKPGVKSHRWIHGDRDDEDEELIEYTFEQMKDIPTENRQAQLRAVIAFVTPEGGVYTETAATRGIIPEKPSDVRVTGFPYRSILFLPEIDKYYDHDALTIEETEKYNHRKEILQTLTPNIKTYFGL